MGQKVNPIGLRIGINRGWDSIWFAKKNEYGNLLIEVGTLFGSQKKVNLENY